MYISIEKQIEHCLNKISRKQHCIKMSKYGAEITPYLDNFPVVQRIRISRTCNY